MFRKAILCGLIPALAGVAANAADECYVVGTWNLEHFRDGATRGFPERAGGIPSRTSADIDAIAEAIRGTMRARVLALQEVNGRGTSSTTSDELDALVTSLGPTYRYHVARSGRTQRVAFLWDEEFARMNAIHEINVPAQRIEDADIFARNPLLGHFTLLVDGEPKTDFLFIGLHLASGQHRTKNHDAAMDRLVEELDRLKGQEDVYPIGEVDVLIGGDLNASWYDGNREEFFDMFNEDGWRVLAHKFRGYPATRVNGSQIDYLIASHETQDTSGLVRDEIEDDEAIVWQGLAWNGRFRYRDVYSDHFPVTTCVNLVNDAD